MSERNQFFQLNRKTSFYLIGIFRAMGKTYELEEEFEYSNNPNEHYNQGYNN